MLPCSHLRGFPCCSPQEKDCCLSFKLPYCPSPDGQEQEEVEHVGLEGADVDRRED